MANNFKTNNRVTNLKAINQKPAEQQFPFFNAFKILDIFDFKIFLLDIRGNLLIS